MVIILAAGCKDNILPIKQKTAVAPIFDLQKDYSDFKMKMTESDSLWIYIDRSICVSDGFEKLLVTKEGDSLKINSQLKNSDTKNKDWEKIYEKKLSINDTNWGFAEFLNKNKDKLKMEDSGGRIVVTDGKTKLNYSSEGGLIASLKFMDDINQTMEVLHPNKNYYLVHYPPPE